MIMNQLISLLVRGRGGSNAKGCDDDISDRMTRKFTCMTLGISSVLMTTTHYVGHVIDCWCPAEFTSSHVDYANDLCWVSGTYYVPMANQIPLELEDESRKISYYQWVPFILLTMALLCQVPNLVWKFLIARAGFSISSAVGTAATAMHRSEEKDKDKDPIKFVAKQLHRYLRAKRAKFTHVTATGSEEKKNCACELWQVTRETYRGSFLTISYFLVKILYICNALLQLYLLDSFLGMEFHFYGIQELHRLMTGQDHAPGEGRFPTVTLCSFEVRRQTQLHKHILQCVLPINLFNERLFLFLWFWFAFLAVMSFYSACVWSFKLCLTSNRKQFIRNQLAYQYTEVNKDHFQQFYSSDLKCDGVLIARLLQVNVGCIAVAETVCALWELKFTTAQAKRKTSKTSTSRGKSEAQPMLNGVTYVDV